MNPVSGDGEYVYDALYRLTQAKGREHPGQQPTHQDAQRHAIPHPNDTTALIRYTENYSYDHTGNILAMEHVAGAAGWTRNYQYAATGNRLQGTSAPGDPAGTYSHSYAYNSHGSMASMPHLTAIDWDYAERMKHADKGGGGDVYFTYDSTGQRIRKIYDHSGIVEEHIYLGGWEIYRRHRSGTLELERESLHVTDDTKRIALVETKTVDSEHPGIVPQTRHRYQIDNHLGSTSLELDASSNVISYEEYHPFGTTSFRSADGGAEVSAKRYRYTGKERDDETGLYYYGARYYAAWLGRWTGCDPKVEDGWNLYVYVRGNPVIRIDPDGNESNDWKDVIKTESLPTDNTSVDIGKPINTNTEVVEYSLGEIGGKSVTLPTKEFDIKSKKEEKMLAELAKATYKTDELSPYRDYYIDQGGLPEGVHRLIAPEIAELGLDPREFNTNSKTGFASNLYKTEDGAYVLSFRGTEMNTLEDWKANITQGAGFSSEQHKQAMRLARNVKRAVGNDLLITGHSLGGGLAASAGIATSTKTVTFNAAGVHQNTLSEYRVNQKKAKELVTNYSVIGEILTTSQEIGRNIAPRALGKQIKMWPAKVQDPVKLHSMEAVIEAMHKKY